VTLCILSGKITSHHPRLLGKGRDQSIADLKRDVIIDIFAVGLEIVTMQRRLKFNTENVLKCKRHAMMLQGLHKFQMPFLLIPEIID
jgi:hypothetical protein